MIGRADELIKRATLNPVPGRPKDAAKYLRALFGNKDLSSFLRTASDGELWCAKENITEMFWKIHRTPENIDLMESCLKAITERWSGTAPWQSHI